MVFFGEGIPTDAYFHAVDAAQNCDLMLVVGTSASVAPASHLPGIAKRAGAKILEINPIASDLSRALIDMQIREPAGKAMAKIMQSVRELRS